MRFAADVPLMHTPTITFTLNATIAVLWSVYTSVVSSILPGVAIDSLEITAKGTCNACSA